MALDATSVIGSTELAGSKVNPRGFGAALAGSVSPGQGLIADGIVKGLFSRKAKQQKAKAEVSTGPAFRIGYLAVTADELALESGNQEKRGGHASRRSAGARLAQRGELRRA